MSATFHIALRYIKARRGFTSLVSWFSLAGISLGVAALIVVMSVMGGFRDELLSRILGLTGHALVSEHALSTQEALVYKLKLEQLPNITSAEPFVTGQAMALKNGRAAGVMVRGVQTDDLEAPTLTLVKETLKKGALENLAAGQVLIGTGLAGRLGLGAGSVMTLLSPDGTNTPVGFIPRMKRYTVGGVFNIGMQQYDNSLVVMPLGRAQRFFQQKNTVTALDVRVTLPDYIERHIPLMRAVIGEEPVIRTWKDANSQFFDALQVERWAMFIVLSMIVLVAAFNIITGQAMMVNDKRGDIAILRTMGGRRNDILRIFFWNGALIGGIGTGAGVGLGVAVVHFIHPIVAFMETLFGVAIFSGGAWFLEEIPTSLQMSTVLTVSGLSMGLALLASLFPALYAARLQPVEILRYE